MARVQTIDGFLGEVRAASTAGGGQALATTLSATNGTIFLPIGTRWFSMTPRNFSTAVVAKVRFGPWVDVLVTNDNHATFIDYSDAAQDAETTNDVVLGAMKTLANGGATYLGSPVPFSGLWVDVGSANAVVSTLTASYWTGNAWTSLSATDNTASGSATFAVDGTVTWTVPSTVGPGILWAPDSFNHVLQATSFDPTIAKYSFGPAGAGTTPPQSTTQTDAQYWVQLKVSTALTAATSLDKLGAQNRSAAYMELVSGQTFDEYIPSMRGGPVAWIEAITDAGTGNLIVNAASLGKFA